MWLLGYGGCLSNCLRLHFGTRYPGASGEPDWTMEVALQSCFDGGGGRKGGWWLGWWPSLPGLGGYSNKLSEIW